jgi:hypothetical protein
VTAPDGTSRANVTLADVRRAVEGEFLPRIEGPISVFSNETIEALAIGHRAAELYRAAVDVAPRYQSAAHVLVRSLLEIAILATWISKAPDPRVRMWQAETQRVRLRDAARFDQYLAWQQEPAETLSPTTLSEVRAEIDQARAAAIAAGEPIGSGGSLLPTVQAMAKVDPDLWETYHLLYRHFSTWSHSAKWSMSGASLANRDDGVYLIDTGKGWGPEGIEQAALIGIILAIMAVSRVAELDLHDRAEALWNAYNPPRPRGGPTPRS